MKQRYLILILLSMGLIAGAASLAAAVTPLSGTVLGSGHVSDSIGTDAKVKVTSIVYYHNGVRHSLDPSVTFHVSPADHMYNVFTFVIKARYDGPAGTYGQILLGDGNSHTHEDYKVFPPGKVTTLKCTHGWEPGSDLALYMFCSGPEFVPRVDYEFYLDRP